MKKKIASKMKEEIIRKQEEYDEILKQLNSVENEMQEAKIHKEIAESVISRLN